MDLTQLLTGLERLKGSDLYLTADSPPLYRVDGATVEAHPGVLDPLAVETLILGTLTPLELQQLEKTHELNTARTIPKVGRFRLNVFQQRGQIGLVARLIPIKFPGIAALGLPDILTDIVMQKRGLVFVTGATGAGKSNTLAALIDHRNQNSRGHIITIEDPIEFVHHHRGCVVTQREVGVDTFSFASGLKSALRQAPDVVLIGEIRDREVMEAALHFAETGHLVLGTLHANNANQAIDRIINFFDVSFHSQLFTQLSLNLRGIISQRLVARADGQGRVVAVEVMLNSPRVSDLLSKGDIISLKGAMEINSQDGSRTFDQALYELYRVGKITLDEALRQADSKNNLRLRIKMEDAAGLTGDKAGFTIQREEEAA